MENASKQPNFGNNFEDKELQQFLQDVEELIVEEALVRGTSREERVINFQHPEQLKDILSLAIDDGPCSYDGLLEMCTKVIQYSVKTGHPRFFNQLFSGITAFGLAGAWVTESLNTNIHTYETSPVFVLMDNYIIEKMCGIVGYENGDGLFCPGGAFSNIMGLNVSRYKMCPDNKKDGVYGLKRLKIYVSGEGHYSVTKGAMFLGMGSSSVVKVASDDRGRMDPKVLEQEIIKDKEHGEVPMCVMATSGTTVLGSFDPLDALADICERHGVWLHTDACWGGAALLSAKHKHLLKGIHRTQSVSWNMHKLTSAPVQCAIFLLKEKGLLEECNRINVEYLFQPDKCYDTSYDIGHKTVQCGRKVDSLKLWLMWKAIGNAGMKSLVDKAFDNARYFTEKIRNRKGFRLVLPEFTSVCFWFIPKSLWGKEETPEWWAALSLILGIIALLRCRNFLLTTRLAGRVNNLKYTYERCVTTLVHETGIREKLEYWREMCITNPMKPIDTYAELVDSYGTEYEHYHSKQIQGKQLHMKCCGETRLTVLDSRGSIQFTYTSTTNSCNRRLPQK